MDKLPKPLLPKLWLFMLSLIGVLALGSGLGERWRGVSPRAAGAVVAVVVGRPDGQVERLGPQSDRGASPPPLDPSSEAQPSLSESLDFLQNLPQNTWWIVAAIPALLMVMGSLIAWLSGSQRPAAEEDQDPEGEDVDRQGVVPSDSDIPSVGAVASVSPGESARVPALSPGLGADATAEADPLPPEAQLVATGETVPQPPTNKLEQARADLAAGRQQLRATQYEAALLCFNSAIEATEVERLKAEVLGTLMGGINAIATLAQTQRGHALGLLEQSGEAMASYNTALGLNSAAVEAWIGKGRLLIALGRYEEALFCFDSALELDSSLGPAWAGKGQALLRLGRHAEGQTCHHRALGLGLESLGPLPPYPTLDPSTLLAAGDASTPAWPSDADVPLDQPALSSPENGDPDVPLNLQQLVMGLPSADTDLAYAFPSDYGVPTALVADVADLPSQAETRVEAPTRPGMAADPSPVTHDLGTAPWVGPIPESSEAEDSPLDDTDPSPNPERLVETHWNPDQSWPTPPAARIQSGINLTLDRSQGPRFYALWHIEEEDRVQAKRSGGEVLAVRLYDVTGHPTQTPQPPPVEEQRCHDDFAQDWYLGIPCWDRMYLAEVGYLSNAGQWQVIARSSEVSAIAKG
jgi:tetratricopeptide (TPR) repeat protein